MNDYQLKLVKIEGEFVWHAHDDTDEAFLVLAGSMRIEFRDGVSNRDGPWKDSAAFRASVERYDERYREGAYLETHAEHMRRWHG